MRGRATSDTLRTIEGLLMYVARRNGTYKHTIPAPGVLIVRGLSSYYILLVRRIDKSTKLVVNKIIYIITSYYLAT